MDTAAVLETYNGQLVDGKFPLLERLGGSHGSDVYLTELPNGSGSAVIKLFPADDRNAGRFMGRLEKIAKLSHPHLIRILHFGRCTIKSASRVYMVMEYAEEDLSEILPSRPLTPSETEEMLRGILEVLAFLHEQRFVHGHLKPSNVMAVGDRLKISSDSLQVSGQQAVVPAELGPYDAPELGNQPISPAADTWSLGMTLVAALTQNPPAWDRTGKSEPALPDSIPEPFREIAQNCLCLDPNQRWTPAQVEMHLKPALPLVAPRKSRTGILAIAQLVVIALLALMWFVAHRGPKVKAPQTAAKQENQPTVDTHTPVPQPSTPPVSAPKVQTGRSKGAVIERVMPNPSRNARNTIQGKIRVTVGVEVDGSGAVSAATLEKSGPSKYFARLAVESARRWTFEPAQVNGKPVPSEWTIHYRFGRADTEATATEVSP